MKLVIFDCDGTLADSQHAIHSAMATAFETHGLEAPPREAVLSVVGLSLELAVMELLPVARPPEDVHRMAEDYKRAFQALRLQPAFCEPLFPGIRDLLDDLARRDDILLGVATGKSTRGLRSLLEREGLAGHFVTLQTADDHPSKPDPAMLEAAMSETGISPALTAMIGDTTFDVTMARGAGVHAVGVSWGYHPAAELAAAGAGRIATAAADLTGILDDLFETDCAV